MPLPGRRTQVVREQSAKLRCSGSNPLGASKPRSRVLETYRSSRLSLMASDAHPCILIFLTTPRVVLFLILRQEVLPLHLDIASLDITGLSNRGSFLFCHPARSTFLGGGVGLSKTRSLFCVRKNEALALPLPCLSEEMREHFGEEGRQSMGSRRIACGRDADQSFSSCLLINKEIDDP
jgi:hypothetical protein